MLASCLAPDLPSSRQAWFQFAKSPSHSFRDLCEMNTQLGQTLSLPQLLTWRRKNFAHSSFRTRVL